ncbi:MAG: hypothetical protein E2O54_08005 [Gammaproteobacteria bacterium]|nr:MAG: hypothetical protein E2O54_08005 [Gammaproteobacteria bacterium]
MKSLFSEHPNAVGESYLMHMLQATRFAGRLLLAGGACLIHAVLPFLFVKTASETIAELYDRMALNRAHPRVATRQVAVGAEAS